MTATDLLPRLAAIGAHLARSAPALVVALIAFLESMVRALDAAVIARPDREAAESPPGPPGDDDELHELLRRLIGWSPARHGEVDRAAREVREMAAGREALILLGEGSLVGVARRLTLGDRPFVALRRGDSVPDVLKRAAGGVVYLDARPRHLPRDLAPLVAGVREARVRLVVGAEGVEESAGLAAMLPRVATIRIPPLAERSDEIERLLEAYGRDAMAELGATGLGFRPLDPEWARASGLATLAEIEDVARRLVALRNWGVVGGAARLGIDHSALSRWARRRKIPT